MQNPAFMNMAEKLGTQLMQDPQMAGMLQVRPSCSARHQPSTTQLPQPPPSRQELYLTRNGSVPRRSRY